MNHGPACMHVAHIHQVTVDRSRRASVQLAQTARSLHECRTAGTAHSFCTEPQCYISMPALLSLCLRLHVTSASAPEGALLLAEGQVKQCLHVQACRNPGQAKI